MALMIKLRPEEGAILNGVEIANGGTHNLTLKILSSDAKFLRMSECVPDDSPDSLYTEWAMWAEDIVSGELLEVEVEDLVADIEGHLDTVGDDAKDTLRTVVTLLKSKQDYKAFKLLKTLIPEG